MTITLSDVLGFISSQATSEDLNAMIPLLNERRKILAKVSASLNKAVLTPGTLVQLTGLKPAYLNGLTGFVKGPGRRPNDLKVEFDDASRFLARRYGTTVDVPANDLVKVETIDA
jgi:hypothetical protein